MTNHPDIRSRVLLVEDEAMIAMLIEEMLADFDCDVAATAGQLDEAVALARTERFDLAFVDVNLGGVAAYPVAQALQARGIPFAFVTGYGTAATDAAHADAPILQKPFRCQELEAVIQLLRSRLQRAAA
jgi:DNA-binding response OmpR family regulator